MANLHRGKPEHSWQKRLHGVYCVMITGLLVDIATSQKRVCDMGLGKGICQALGRVKWVGQSLSAKQSRWTEGGGLLLI